MTASSAPKNDQQDPATPRKTNNHLEGLMLTSAGVSCEQFLIKNETVESCIFRLNAAIQKAPSPALNIKLNDTSGIAIIDEGSELNCVDEAFIKLSGCEMISTNVGAKGAGDYNIAIGGQTKDPVHVSICGEDYVAPIDLGICLVVKNLGASVLIGQPAKEDHEIVTIPHHKEIYFKDIEGCDRKCAMLKRSRKLEAKATAEVMRLEEDKLVYLGDSIIYTLHTT